MAFELPPGVVATTPEDGSVYEGEANSYKVENPTHRPAYSTKFETIGEGIKDGESDTVEYTLPAGAPILETQRVQVKYGRKTVTLTFDLSECLPSGGNGSIGDYVWHDLFHSQTHQVDGIQDDGEPGIEGVTVELYDGSGNSLATTTTDANGYYQFTDLPAGAYTVKIADGNFATGGVLEGWYASPPDRGSDDARDSDGYRMTHQATVTLAAGEHNPTIDFGFFRTCIDLQKTGPMSVAVGEEIVYHFVVTNCGDLVLHGGAHVYDPLIEPDGNHEIWSGVVWPGEVYEFDRTYTPGTSGSGYKSDRTYISVTDSDDEGNSWEMQVKCPPPPPDECGDLTNIATAVGHPKHPDGYYVADVTDEASWTVWVECPVSYQGCTPGYWKQDQHFDSWVAYETDDLYDAVFSVPYYKTLLEALKKGGGGENALGRHAVAALLNAANPGVSYAYTESDIIAMVQAAYAPGGDVEVTKNLLAAQNEAGCPLN
jgi:hypothetical protein